MKSWMGIIIGSAALLIAIVLISVYSPTGKNKQSTIKTPTDQPTMSKNNYMKLTSSAFSNGQFIPSKYTCQGSDINPPLAISDVNPKAQSLALVVDDPDAPGGVWDHWLVVNISPQTTFIAENSLPAGAMELTNSFGKTSYGGPCPPPGKPHHYHFKLYALNKKLTLHPSAAKAELEQAIKESLIDQAELIGVYQR